MYTCLESNDDLCRIHFLEQKRGDNIILKMVIWFFFYIFDGYIVFELQLHIHSYENRHIFLKIMICLHINAGCTLDLYRRHVYGMPPFMRVAYWFQAHLRWTMAQNRIIVAKLLYTSKHKVFRNRFRSSKGA